MTRKEKRIELIREFLSNYNAAVNSLPSESLDTLILGLEEDLDTLPSAHAHEDNVSVHFFDAKLMGEIEAVHFYPGKVKYDVSVAVDVEGHTTKLYNIDSAFISSIKS